MLHAYPIWSLPMLNPTDAYLMLHTRPPRTEQDEEVGQEIWVHTLSARSRRKNLAYGLIVRRSIRSSRRKLYGGRVSESTAQSGGLTCGWTLSDRGETTQPWELPEAQLARAEAVHRLLSAVYESAAAKGDLGEVKALVELYREVGQAWISAPDVWRRTLKYATEAKARLKAAGAWDDLMQALSA